MACCSPACRARGSLRYKRCSALDNSFLCLLQHLLVLGPKMGTFLPTSRAVAHLAQLLLEAALLLPLAPEPLHLLLRHALPLARSASWSCRTMS